MFNYEETPKCHDGMAGMGDCIEDLQETFVQIPPDATIPCYAHAQGAVWARIQDDVRLFINRHAPMMEYTTVLTEAINACKKGSKERRVLQAVLHPSYTLGELE